jgi:hypothetical protein
MHSESKGKKFIVEIFDDRQPIHMQPWVRLGEYVDKSQAVEACKKVIDDFLITPKALKLDTERLVASFLNYGAMPIISGFENHSAFDVYEYLDRRCAELGRSNL